jgi:hypothetical protein
LCLLFYIRQIKTGQRALVVDMPSSKTVGAPSHPGAELFFQMLPSLVNRATEELPETLGFASDVKRFFKIPAESAAEFYHCWGACGVFEFLNGLEKPLLLPSLPFLASL